MLSLAIKYFSYCSSFPAYFTSVCDLILFGMENSFFILSYSKRLNVSAAPWKTALSLSKNKMLPKCEFSLSYRAKHRHFLKVNLITELQDISKLFACLLALRRRLWLNRVHVRKWVKVYGRLVIRFRTTIHTNSYLQTANCARKPGRLATYIADRIRA